MADEDSIREYDERMKTRSDNPEHRRLVRRLRKTHPHIELLYLRTRAWNPLMIIQELDALGCSAVGSFNVLQDRLFRAIIRESEKERAGTRSLEVPWYEEDERSPDAIPVTTANLAMAGSDDEVIPPHRKS